MNKESIKRLKEMVTKSENIELNKSDELLVEYITKKAQEYLNNTNGAVEDKVVVGWAIHFYNESEETINKEMNRVAKPKSVKKTEEKPVKEQLNSNGNQLSLWDV